MCVCVYARVYISTLVTEILIANGRMFKNVTKVFRELSARSATNYFEKILNVKW